MATELKAASEEVKVDLFEDDDEFEEFEINEVPVVQDLLSFSQMNVNVMQRAGNPVTDPILTASILHLDASLLLLVHYFFIYQ
ncbi:hypothetical protein E6C27_scaffold119G00230 [Cucumis melo var. makuwa]|uniref:Uncharacterized protein n=1 Tax=Cucumis melo var. makuwa TaxID=1194695 RepID=A0A5A7T8A9_CUCMM|nr:hypothetical protein E6C27_scaffold119G00230 [Cucumis melo var. makuwa]